MKVLVTGAAGYVGAHVSSELLQSGHEVIGIDNLSTGRRDFVVEGIDFHEGNVQDANFLRKTLRASHIASDLNVIHCAGLKFAGESVKDPLSYFESNSLAVFSLVKVMKEFSLKSLVFSSSCSVYGDTNNGIPVREDYPKFPVSPYGRSKLFAESIISDAVNAGLLSAASLRYFNVAGNANIRAFDQSPFNLLPNLFRSVTQKTPFKIYGTSYQTLDGTCVRDYVDVVTLARIHIRVLEKLDAGEEMKPSYNLGSGIGASVLEIANIVKEKIDSNLQIEFSDARPGDPASILADTSRAELELNWRHNATLEEIVVSSWSAWKKSNRLEAH
jgi:UDP-glucose 4-epimerase